MNIFYQISTHWDREWYKPFQGFRYELLKAVDIIMEFLEEQRIEQFVFDGQTVVLEDYLEIKPQNRERLTALIQSGRLLVGPWYVMPDELLVSGESIVKNFLIGHSVAKAFKTKAWKFGYLNDIFGHIAQMPQILQGFGIGGAYLGRGVGSGEQNYTNFLWRAPDGSECFAYKQSYSELLRRFSEADDKDAIISEYISKSTDIPVAILNYTDDHAIPNEDTCDFYKRMTRLSETEHVVCGIEKALELQRKYKHKLPCESGELIITGETQADLRAVTHSISSYYPIKRENDVCENILENQMAPMLAISSLLKFGLEENFLKLAYKYLLKNQAHDSICGCSVDTVHRDMFYRYSQIHSIADAMREYFFEHMGMCTPAQNEFILKIFNFGLQSVKRTIEVDLFFEKGWECERTDNAGYQTIHDFVLVNANGEEVPYQITAIKNDYVVSEHQNNRYVDKYSVAFSAELPSFGAACYKVLAKKYTRRYIKKCADSVMTAENEYIRLTVKENGTLTIEDKERQISYSGIGTFIDDGEAGNGWFHEPPYGRNNIVSSQGAVTSIERLRDGELLTTFRIKMRMDIPKKLDYQSGCRSDETVTMKIVTDVTLREGNREVEFETVIDNCADDHRVRIEFPTGLRGEDYYASQAFAYVKRYRGISAEGAMYREPEAYEKNTSGIITVENEDGIRLSFLGKEGFHEAGVSEDGVISVTLLRGFGRILVHANKPTFSQIKGQHRFKYAISTEQNPVKLLRIKKEMMEKSLAISAGDTAEQSLMELVSDSLAVSVVKPSENGKGIISRLYNPTEKTAAGKLKFRFPVKNVAEVTLSEEKIKECRLEENSVEITLASYKIMTVYAEVEK